jgi:hypothetical protein
MESFVNKVVLGERNIYYLNATYFRKKPGELRAPGKWPSSRTQAKTGDI